VNLILAPHDRPSLRVARMAKPDAYQIDPAVLGDLDLVARVAAERRPVLVVAGGCTLAAIGAALEAVGRRPVVLLHTVTAQALPPSNARLRYLLAFAERFKVPVGYFGQEPGIGWAFVAATLGAVVVEKRITVDRTLPGASHTASIDAAELGAMVTGLADLAGALAPVGERRVFRDELASLEATSQSLVARRAMRQGHRLRASDIGSAVAAGGISPRLSPWAIGRRLRYDVEAGDPLTFGIVDTR
jgi:sialic acid synthase SpsE